LFQDIGIGAMFLARSEDYLSVRDEKTVSGRTLSEVEREVFSFDHQELGAALLKKWGLPENIYLPVQYHHRPDNAPLQLRTLCRVISASSHVSGVYYGNGSARNVRRSKELLREWFDLVENRAMSLIDAVAQKSDEVLSQFKLGSAKLQTYSQLLEKANQELSRLNFSSEVLVLEFKEAKKKADHLAAQLKAANEKLRNIAFRDEMTGLYNHGFFQESLMSELRSAQRTRQPLSLIIFDVDKFKTINVTYGHQSGDIALRFIADYLRQNTRSSDIAARYGGDEFVIILKETPLNVAMARATAICEGVRSMPANLGGSSITITISVGVAACDPGKELTNSQLIQQADEALYRSKHDGRNRVSFQYGDLVGR